jgi:hypothetical protein
MLPDDDDRDARITLFRRSTKSAMRLLVSMSEEVKGWIDRVPPTREFELRAHACPTVPGPNLQSRCNRWPNYMDDA